MPPWHPFPARTSRGETFHRLNRAEYQNAVRDLLDVELDVSEFLPADDASEQGFDNMAAVLSVSPALLERYMSTARKVSHLAVGIAPSAPTVETYRIPLLMYQDDRLSEDLPFGSRGGIAIRHRFPVDGEYSLKLRLQRTYTDYIRGLGTPQHLDVRVDGRLIKRFTVGGEAPEYAKAAPDSFAGNAPLYGIPSGKSTCSRRTMTSRSRSRPRLASAWLASRSKGSSGTDRVSTCNQRALGWQCGGGQRRAWRALYRRWPG